MGRGRPDWGFDLISARGNYVIVEPVYEKTVGSIILPDGVEKREANCWGLVVSVGPEFKYEVKTGDKVIFRRHEGYEIEENGKKLLCLKGRWILTQMEETDGYLSNA